jgi:hypothetical protein
MSSILSPWMFHLKSACFPAVLSFFFPIGRKHHFHLGQPTGWVETNLLVFWYHLYHLRSPAKQLHFLCRLSGRLAMNPQISVLKSFKSPNCTYPIITLNAKLAWSQKNVDTPYKKIMVSQITLILNTPITWVWGHASWHDHEVHHPSGRDAQSKAKGMDFRFIGPLLVDS